MSWTCYEVTLRLLTPLHIGWMKEGNLQRTRPYALGKNIWAALTMRLTRDDPSLGRAYREVGSRVQQDLAFSYFYPGTEADGCVPVWPWDDPERFSWLFLGAAAATSINPGRRAAEETSLHETEYISSCTREGNPVHLVGCIFVRDGSDLRWREALSRLQVGGERSYGWGRLQPRGEPRPVQAPACLWGWQMHLSGRRPVLSGASGSTLHAHALADGLQVTSGTLEPLVGRETTDAARHGAAVAAARLSWAPGSAVGAATEVELIENGIWRALIPGTA